MVKNIVMLCVSLLLLMFLVSNKVSALKDNTQEYCVDSEMYFLNSIGIDKLRNNFVDKFIILDADTEKNNILIRENRELNNKIKKPINEYVKKSISTVLGAIFVVFFNTLFVLSMIWILYNGKTFGEVFVNKTFIMGLVTINFVVEIIVTPILSVPVAFAVDKFLKKNKKQVVTDKDIEYLENINYIESVDKDYKNIDINENNVDSNINLENEDFKK